MKEHENITDMCWLMIKHYDDHRMHTLKFSTTVTAGILTVATTIYVLRYNLEFPLFRQTGFPPSTELPIMPFLYRTMTAWFLLGWAVTALSLIHMLHLQKASLSNWGRIESGYNASELSENNKQSSSLLPASEKAMRFGVYGPFIGSALIIIVEASLLFAAAVKTGSAILIDGGISELYTILVFFLFSVMCLAFWLLLSRSATRKAFPDKDL